MAKLADEERVFVEYWDKIKDHPDIKNRGLKTPFPDKYFVFFKDTILDDRGYEVPAGKHYSFNKIVDVLIDKKIKIPDYLFEDNLGRVRYSYKVLIEGDFKAKLMTHGARNQNVLWSNECLFYYFSNEGHRTKFRQRYLHVNKAGEWSLVFLPDVYEKYKTDWERYRTWFFNSRKIRYFNVTDWWEKICKENEPLYDLASKCDPLAFLESFLYEKNPNADIKSSKDDRLEFAKHIEEKLRIMQTKDTQPIEYRVACVIAENNPEAFDVESNEDGLKVFKIKTGLQFYMGQCNKKKISFEKLREYISGELYFYPSNLK